MSAVARTWQNGRSEFGGPPVAPVLQHDTASGSHEGGIVMLYWAAVFFVIAIAAALLGFGGLAAGAAGIAKILFFVFLAFAVVSFLFGRRPVV
jgi:uncharacterized membrane protein YtjA (UPF0391 family)